MGESAEDYQLEQDIKEARMDLGDMGNTTTYRKRDLMPPGKGCLYRKVDKKKYDKNFERIFGKDKGNE